MGLFDFLFRRNKHAPPPVPGKTPEALQPAAQGAQQMAPGTQIAYSPDLIAQLKAEHQQLLNIFGMIGAAFSANDLPLTARLLDNFRHGRRRTC